MLLYWLSLPTWNSNFRKLLHGDLKYLSLDRRQAPLTALLANRMLETCHSRTADGPHHCGSLLLSLTWEVFKFILCINNLLHRMQGEYSNEHSRQAVHVCVIPKCSASQGTHVHSMTHMSSRACCPQPQFLDLPEAEILASRREMSSWRRPCRSCGRVL